MSFNSKIVFFTSARSDFGILSRVIDELNKLSIVQVIATGAHTSDPLSGSLREVENFCSKKNIYLEKFKFHQCDNEDSICQISAISSVQKEISKFLKKSKPDLIVLLGDRWELYSISIPSLILRIPIAHISGGEITLGAIDELIRHSLTKLSHLHFVSCNEYARNISLMGEEDWRITISGECGLDWIHNSKLVPKEKICNEFNISLNLQNKLSLFTYHPTSYGNTKILKGELDVLISILEFYKNIDFIITGPGMELGSEKARNTFKEISKNMNHIFYIEHLGRENYLSMMKYSDFVIGNSSSGICEAPSVGTPSINIGNRQEGRLRANSTVDCNFNFDSISNALESILSKNSQDIIKEIYNPYDPYLDGKNSERIAKTCLYALNSIQKDKLLKKLFDQKVNQKLWNSLKL